MDLDMIRKQIDIVDERLMNVYKERKELVKKVAEYKLANDLPILNEDREREVCEQLVQKFGEDMRRDIYSLYPVIMNISKLIQSRIKKTSIEALLQIDLNKTNGFSKSPKVAVQGVKELIL